jgi:hypothetical protein
MIFTKSQLGLILASVVTLYLTWAALQSDSSAEIALPTRTLSGSSLPANSQPAKMMDKQASFSLQDKLQQRDPVPLTGDLFTAPKVVVYQPAPVAKTKFVASAPVPLPLPKPVAPPLPFKYFGRFQDDDKNAVMIDYLGDVIPIKVGDIVANQYKVVAINESANSVQIQFLMMPLNQIQTMQARAGQP